MLSFMKSNFLSPKVSKQRKAKERKANNGQTLTGLGKLVGKKTIGPCKSDHTRVS